MAGKFICTVLQVKPYSGYYRSCPRCKRKLRIAELTLLPDENSRYYCRSCHADYGPGELEFYYCLILTVTDNTTGTVHTVSLFGRVLERVFGATATQLHKHLSDLCDEGMVGHELMIRTLGTLLIGSCIELLFDQGVRVLGPNSNDTVFSLLTNQVAPSPSRDLTVCKAAVPTQQNSTSHNSSSFLYDSFTQSSKVGPRSVGYPLLKLESFLEDSQPIVSPPDQEAGSHYFGLTDSRLTDDTLHGRDKEEVSEEIVSELEAEWENSQQSQQLSDIDLAFSEDVMSELQQTFTVSRETSPAPTANQSSTTIPWAVTPIATSTSDNGRLWSRSSTSHCETPELFSSHKKLTQQSRLAEQLSFTPELFDPTPCVCRYKSGPSTGRGGLMSSWRRSTHTPNTKFSHGDNHPLGTSLSTPLPHPDSCSAAVGNPELHTHTTPLTQSKQSFDLGYTVSSPDLFSQWN